MKKVREPNQIQKNLIAAIATIFLLLVSFFVYAQDGNAGINEANTKVRIYFAAGTNLMYD